MTFLCHAAPSRCSGPACVPRPYFGPSQAFSIVRIWSRVPQTAKMSPGWSGRSSGAGAMEPAEFRRVLHNGLGRAIRYLREHDAAPHREALLHACSSFDLREAARRHFRAEKGRE